MNKKRVDDWIIPAKKALAEVGIAKDGKIERGFRAQISSFGAAVVMGSLRSALMFFAEKGGSSSDRPKLIEAIYYVINGEHKSVKEVLDDVFAKDEKEIKDKIIDASIALKLAMSFYELV